ncbi:ubiquinol-cytochrome c reductase iron-sulfur subunit [Quadrisphaera sp. DSM 44207]|uniref:cytochrome bc1 complex Rieske iron-sulfur subunit n=1 Tax=Quadrisphaera sp. DSM 44207 TaxID=1881057 RepID=UPI000882BF2A|nr:Rieske 2Fe-2S domain-containing protein [Quadrisphaera sp. DSM 44207]SDQ33156.1 menaquinol-cytochrome c reductase iron-sulfur subunit precursor [Quadrisphaera sp. DSM 44207]
MKDDEHDLIPSQGLAAPDDRPLPDRFANPGLAPHRFRTTDTDTRAAKRAERQVATIFGISALGSVLAIVSYLVFDLEGTFASVQRSTIFLGLGLGLAIFCIGIGAVHWARTLMPDHEQVEERHPIGGNDVERAQAAAILEDGLEESGLGRRKLIRNSLFGAAALAPVPAVLTLGDLGPLPGTKPYETLWSSGVRLARDPDEKPIRAEDVTLGSVFHVVPEGLSESEHPLEEKAKAAVLLVRIEPGQVRQDPERVGWDVDGIYAYSKICTHVGCPVALYEQQTHHLLCPCHQSTFDLTQHCRVIFGPAVRPLPQLPITVDDEGYLVATAGLSDTPGPSFWERG